MNDGFELQHREVIERHVSPGYLARQWGVSLRTVYRDIAKGALPASRVGSGNRFRVKWIDAKRYGRPIDFK